MLQCVIQLVDNSTSACIPGAVHVWQNAGRQRVNGQAWDLKRCRLCGCLRRVYP